MFPRLPVTRVVTQEDAVRSIAAEFPNVSPRIITDVVTAYCTCCKSVPAATRAARARLRDACAVGG